MKISASLYSTKKQDLPSLVHELDELNLDYFHIDCFDKDAEKIHKDIQAIQAISNTPIDLHVISSRLSFFIDKAKEWHVEQLTFQYENIQDQFDIPQDVPFKIGLALTNDTDLHVLEAYQKDIDYILLMTTTPGKSGGTFEKSSFERIRLCKKMYPHLPIYVDGGINAEVSFILRLLGVSMAVSGSFLVNNTNIAVALSDLRFHQKGSHFLVKDFMLCKGDLPILAYKNVTFKQVIETIEYYKMGVVFFTENEKLVGICSNADMRKALLKNISNLNAVSIEDMINKTPIVLQENASTYEMIDRVKKHDFPLLFLPVIDDSNTLKGAITFNELIKGEG